MRAKLRTILCLIGTAGMMLNGSSAKAGTVTYNFDTNPTNAPNAIEVYQAGFADGNGDSVYWKATGGNPATGGFLGLTWPIGSSSSIVIFPDIDPGKVVTAFTFDTDLRIGNPQQNVRAADGFSINFARASDPVFENHASSDFATSGAVETGTQTGLAISFDTWAGNALPDGADLEGIIVRVDNKTVLRYAMPTRNGACADTTSLQTGPRQDAYWDDPDTGAKALGTLPDAAFLPETWTNLCWQHLSVVLDTNATLTVTYKGLKLLDKFQTTFFPSAGRIVLAGRTGGADEHGHFDNLTLTTIASTDASPPTAPANLKVADVKARKVVLTWDAATDDSGKVAYNVERDGTVIATFLTGATYTDRAVVPSKTYSYKVQSTDPAGNKSAFTTATTATTLAEVLSDAPGYLTFETWSDITGTAVDALTSDARYPDAPTFKSVASAADTRKVYADDSHENYGGRLTGWLTPTDTADYDFFLRSDDASQLWLSTDATAANLAQIAEETGCCDAYHETGAGDPETTAAPIHLIANTKYYIQVLWKEGGGGDYAQVAWRKAGDTTAAGLLTPIPGTFLSTKADTSAGPPVITKQPKGQTVDVGATATFSVEALLGEQPVTYQWRLTGQSLATQDIIGGTNKDLAINNVGIKNIGLYSVAVSNGEGTAISGFAGLFLSGTLFVEGEDANYGAGLYVKGKPIGMDGPYPGDAYNGLGTAADEGIDWSALGGNAAQTYRPDTGIAAGKENAHADGIPRGSFDVKANWVVGWNDNGDWYNYTRDFPTPAKDYNVVVRTASGGAPINAQMDEVTGGATTATQTLVKLGVVNPGRATAAWDNMEFFPLTDTNGVPVTIKNWGGTKTFRYSLVTGAAWDVDYYMWIPVGGGTVTPPTGAFTGISKQGANIVIQYSPATAVLQSAPSLPGTWTDVTGATGGTYSAPLADAPRYFRFKP